MKLTVPFLQPVFCSAVPAVSSIKIIGMTTHRGWSVCRYLSVFAASPSRPLGRAHVPRPTTESRLFVRPLSCECVHCSRSGGGLARTLCARVNERFVVKTMVEVEV